MAKLNDQVVIITGAGRGIGFGVAKAFAAEGAHIVLTDIVESCLIEAKAELERDYGVQVLTVVADGSKEEEVEAVIEKTIERFGCINCLINNAQASKSGLLLIEHTKEDFALGINTGLYATFFYMKAAFPYLKETKGSVINFASGAGLKGAYGQSSYAAAKEGIRGLSRAAATEWGEFDINVNVVCPLVMTEHLASWQNEYPEAYEQTIKGIPLRRFGDAQKDIGRVCVFLASEEASYLTGETLSLQGGGGLRP